LLRQACARGRAHQRRATARIALRVVRTFNAAKRATSERDTNWRRVVGA
jgi:hypothetical protein